MKITTKLDSDNIKGLVLGLAIPSMIAQFVSVLYSIVDRMYIGNIPAIGEIALAGVGICGPIVTLLTSFSALIGYGGGPLVSIKLGERREDLAEKILSNCFLMLLAVAVLITAAAFLFKERLLWWFGASEATFPYANEYMSVYLSGTVFALLSAGMNQFIIVQGYSGIAMRSVLIGAVSNIILDPVFIFVLGLNVSGAAIATVISQLLSCAFVLRFLFSSKSRLRIRFVRIEPRIVRKVCLIGLTSFFIIFFDNIMLISLNAMLTRHGGAQGDMLLTCNTILQSFMLLITMPLGGITSGTQTILGYNYGAKRPDKILKAEKSILLLSLLFCGAGLCFAELFPKYFIYIFTRDAAYVAMTEHIIRIYASSALFMAVQYAIVDGFTGMSFYKVALPLSAFRKVLFFACVFIIPSVAGIENIFFCEPISDICGSIVSSLFFLTIGIRLINHAGE